MNVSTLLVSPVILQERLWLPAGVTILRAEHDPFSHVLRLTIAGDNVPDGGECVAYYEKDRFVEFRRGP